MTVTIIDTISSTGYISFYPEGNKSKTTPLRLIEGINTNITTYNNLTSSGNAVYNAGLRLSGSNQLFKYNRLF